MHSLRASQPPALVYGEGEPLPLPLALPCPLRPKAVAPLHHPPLISFAPPPARAPLSSVLHLWPFCREKMDGDFFSISPHLSGIAIHFLASSCPAGVGQRGSPCRRRGKGGGGCWSGALVYSGRHRPRASYFGQAQRVPLTSLPPDLAPLRSAPLARYARSHPPPESARYVSGMEDAGAAPRLPRTPSGAWRFAPRGALSLVVWNAPHPPEDTP